MHTEAYNYVKDTLRNMPPRHRVIEFGGRFINGSIRGLFDGTEYVSVDLYEGQGVDVVGDAEFFYSDGPVDTVICCEVLEHAPNWRELVQHAYELLSSDGNGYFIMTCATHPRPPHSSMDGYPLDGAPTEYYGNVDPEELGNVLARVGFVQAMTEIHEDRGDLYCVSIKGRA